MMSSLSQYLVYCARVGVFPEWHRFLFRRNMRSKKLSGIQSIRKFATDQLHSKFDAMQPHEKEGDPREAKDFIARFVRLRNQDTDKISLDEIASLCIMNIGAGSDTTSIAFTAILFYLTKYPTTLQCLTEEIKDAQERGVISNPITFAEAQKLPYLQAVIKEALRMHPATGLCLGRVVPEQGATLAGQFFPGGVRVLIPFSLHYHTTQCLRMSTFRLSSA